MTQRALALGIDLGSTSARAHLFDAAGHGAGGSKIRHEWRTTPDGGVEADAESLVRLVARAVDGALDLARASGARIVAVGTSALWQSVLGLDARGAPVTPLLAWNDMRSRDLCARLRRRVDERSLHHRTGAMVHPSYVAPRVAWLRESRPDAFARAHWWMSAGEFLGMRLFGERAVTTAMASGSGLLDQHTGDWDAATLEMAGIGRDQLSPIVDTGALHGGPLRAEFAERWPSLAGVPWLMALGDGACANVGSGCTSAGRMSLSLGTTAATRVLVPVAGRSIPESLWAYRFDRTRWLVGGALSNGGNVHRRLRELLRLPDEESCERAVAALEPDARKIDMLPFFAGERSPDWPLAARAIIHGLTLDTAPAEILRAGMEAVAYRLAALRRLVLDAVPEARLVVASGAPLERSPTWARILADVLGEPLRISEEAEASARGAALIALHSAGEIGDPSDAPMPPYRIIDPDAARHERYAAAMTRHRELLPDAEPDRPG